MIIEQLEPRRMFSAGQIDTTFGTNGRVLTVLPETRLGINDAVSMNDGRVVAAGFATLKGQLSGYSVARYHADGSLDRTFGGGGVITQQVDGKVLDVHVAVSQSGEVVVAWTAGKNASGSYITAFHEDGTLNESFGVNGSSGSSIDVKCLTTAPNGEIVLGGSKGNHLYRYGLHANSRGAVEVFKPSGFHDRTFGDRGVHVLTTPFDQETGNTGIVTDVSVKSDGRIVAVDDEHYYRYYPFDPEEGPAGYDDYFATPIFLIAPSGSAATDSMYIDSDAVRLLNGLVDAHVDEDGRVTLVSENSFDSVWGYRPDGTLDEALFSEGESIYSNHAVNFIFESNSVSEILTSSHRQLIVTSARDVGQQPPELVRLNYDGSVDDAFGEKGVCAIPTSSLNVARTLVAGDGSIWVLGSHKGSFAITRIASDDAPTATARYAERTSTAATTQKIFVKYRDDIGVYAPSIDRNDLRVYLPDGTSRPVSFFSKKTLGSNIEATYAFAAPGGVWDAADNGEYIVRVKGKQVTDIDGNAMEGRAIGTFLVKIK